MDNELNGKIILTDLVLCKILKLIAKRERKWSVFVRWELINKRLANLLDSVFWSKIRSIKVNYYHGRWPISSRDEMDITLSNSAMITVPGEAKPLLYLKRKGIKYTFMKSFIWHLPNEIDELGSNPVPAWFKDAAPPIINTTLCNYSGSEKITLQLLAEHESSIKHLLLVADKRYCTFIWSLLFRNATDFSMTLKEIVRLKYRGGLKQLTRVTVLMADRFFPIRESLKQHVVSMISVIRPQCLDFTNIVKWLTDSTIIKAIQLSQAKCLRVYAPCPNSLHRLGITFTNIESLSLRYINSPCPGIYYRFDWRIHRIPNYFPKLRHLGLQVLQLVEQSQGNPEIFRRYQHFEKLNEGRFNQIKMKICFYFEKWDRFKYTEDTEGSWYSASEITNLISEKYPMHRIRVNKSGDVHFKFNDYINIYYHTKPTRSHDVHCACFGHEMYRHGSRTLFEKCTHLCFCEHF